MARPEPRYDPEEVVEAIRENSGVVKDAAQDLGCHRRTMYLYKDRYEEVAEAIKEYRPHLVGEAREKVQDVMRGELDGQGVSPRLQYDAALKLLAVFDEEVDWADRKRTDVTSGGEPVSSIQLQVVETDPDTFEQERRQD